MTISVVQTLKVADGWSGSFSANVTAGNSLVLIVTAYTSSGATLGSSAPLYNGASVTGAVKLKDATSPGTTGGTVYTATWLLPNVSGSAKPVAITVTGCDSPPSAGAIGMLAYEVAGLGTSPALDKSNSSTGQGTALTSGASGATTAAPEIIFGSLIIYGETVSLVGGAWTEQQFSDDFSTAGYQIETTSGTSYTYSTTAAAGDDWAGTVVTVKGTGGTGHSTTAALTVTPVLSAPRIHAATDTAALTVTPATAAVGSHGHTDTAALTVTPDLQAIGTNAGSPLKISIAGQPGNDPILGDPYQAGVFAYGLLGSLAGLTIAGGTAQLQLLPPGPAVHATQAASVLAVALNPGAANERILGALSSGKESGNADAGVQVFSASADGTIAPQVIVEFGGVIVVTFTAAGTMAIGGVNSPGITLTPANSTHESSTPGVTVSTRNPGAVNENFLALVTSGKTGADDAALQLFSECADSSVPAFAVLEFGGATAMTVDNANAAFNVPVQPGNGSSPGAKIWSGSGAPTLSGTTGDLYIRKDGGAGTYLYRCTGGTSWTAFA